MTHPRADAVRRHPLKGAAPEARPSRFLGTLDKVPLSTITLK